MTQRRNDPAHRDKLTPAELGHESQHRKPQQPSAVWSQHEHIAQPVQTQAQKLLQEAGSPELAKQAVEQAADEQAGLGQLNLESLAGRWGFRSRHELLAASVSIASPQGDAWWATPVGSRDWYVWNERDAQISDKLPTLDQAREFVAASGNDASQRQTD